MSTSLEAERPKWTRGCCRCPLLCHLCYPHEDSLVCRGTVKEDTDGDEPHTHRSNTFKGQA
eukprot:3161290-Amphidinium_carterae.1